MVNSLLTILLLPGELVVGELSKEGKNEGLDRVDLEREQRYRGATERELRTSKGAEGRFTAEN